MDKSDHSLAGDAAITLGVILALALILYFPQVISLVARFAALAEKG